MLDDVLYSKYPILASGTGSFPERLCGRRLTWIARGCPSNDEWLRAINDIRVGRQPWENKACQPPSYDFLDMKHALLHVKSAVERIDNGTVAKISASDPACAEFLALNPALVLRSGKVSCEVAHREMVENRSAYRLIDRYSLDLAMFHDRNPGVKITKVGSCLPSLLPYPSLV